MRVESVFSDEFRRYGRVWQDIPEELTTSVTTALETSTPMPVATDYVASEPALETLSCAEALKLVLYGGRSAQLGWCNGHNTQLNCLEYHRSSEFNLGARDFILLVAGLDQIESGSLETTLVRAFRVPAGVMVEVFATTLHYAPCQVDEDGFRVMVALPQGTNAPRPQIDPSLAAGDADLLWAADKWLLAHAHSSEASQGAHIGLIGENIDLAHVSMR
ncbi:hypothetical protein Corgl_1719 [Coriobacterium glomerans PW2]|uniref:DUF4867 domain-containing protein n=1 Tax=Coriobacterium glomerans (strain ATCC 49209 / DSM 20642 / JCM 10262 / PW2) TaxID=700015 RepID=F2NB64_CORGP|nr:DUF4867 family protein [Coriobacterium glomerans]AEB07815.1 hypothetical protein Corgl_1719 [Coriobacterium glomerans PW2]